MLGRVLVIVLTLGIPVGRARADDCAKLGGPEATDCASAAHAAADQQLNATYKALLAKLKGNPSRAAGLIADERAWIRKRDADCRARVETYDLNPADYSYAVATLDCLREATEARITQLNSYH